MKTLIDPVQTIPDLTIKIHGITNDMVQGKPKIKEVLPAFLNSSKSHYYWAGIKFDIEMLSKAAEKKPSTMQY